MFYLVACRCDSRAESESQEGSWQMWLIVMWIKFGVALGNDNFDDVCSFLSEKKGRNNNKKGSISI